MHIELTIASSVHSTTASYRLSQALSSKTSIFAVISVVSRGTLFAVEKPTRISPDPCAANDPTRPMPSAERLHRRESCDGNSGASVAMMVMIDPALWRRRSRPNSGSRISPIGMPLTRNDRITPKFDCTSTPSVYSPPFSTATRRELVPMPALKSQVTMPVPAPTEPSPTFPLEACSIAR